MAPLNRLTAVFAALLVVLAVIPPAVAQQGAEPAIVAVLDVQRIMQESSAARDVRSKVEQQRETFQGEIAEKERALRAADQSLLSERPNLSQDVFLQRRKELEEQAAQLRREVQARKEQLEETFNRGVAQIRQALLEIVAGIAQERGVTLVLSRSQVVMAANEMDITEEVMQKLNAKLPKVSLATQQ